jgi:outer membrane protein OmpA-like peptidoglycan-associated protein
MDCRIGANYYHLAKLETDPQSVIEWLDKSVQVCPNFNAWYMLGLMYSRTGRLDQAIDAFAHARLEAGSSKSEALALARQAELLADSGQMPRALHAFELAKRFYPEPTPKWLDESLKKTSTQISSDGRFAVRPAVNLPVHFEFDRANLNSTGSRQVFELGRALVRTKMNQWSFVLVGHTDKRGATIYNQKLSENRAHTVKIELERQFPALAGRLEHRGRGETVLLYDGDSEEDHMLNRRVKVTLAP